MDEGNVSDSSDPAAGSDVDRSNNNLHFKSNRPFQRLLIRCSDEETIYNMYNMIEEILPDQSPVRAWAQIVPNPIYMLDKLRKKKTDPNCLLSEVSDLTTSRSSVLHRPNYELDFVSCPAWKMGIEPMTYRYLPQNGRYRASKLAKRLNTHKAFKKGFSNTKLSTDSEHLQREIYRELRTEFEMFISQERQQSSMLQQLDTKQRLKLDNIQKVDRETHVQQGESNAHSGLSKAFGCNADSTEAIHTASENAFNSDKEEPPVLRMQQLTKEEGEFYLEQVSSRLRDIKQAMIHRSSPNRLEEGYLQATGYSKTDREPKPRFNNRFLKDTSHLLNRNKKLPAIRNESPSGESLEANKKEKQLTNRRFSAVTAASSLSPAIIETPRVALQLSHPLLYYPPDFSQQEMAKNKALSKFSSSEPHLDSVNSVKDDSGHIRLFNEYKLRKGIDNPYEEIDTETLSTIDNIRSSYKFTSNPVMEDDEVSLEARVVDKLRSCSVTDASLARIVDPRGTNITPDYETYAKSQAIHNKSANSLRNSVTTPDTDSFLNDLAPDRRRNAVNSYTRRSRLNDASSDTVAIARNPRATPVNEGAKFVPHSSMRGNFMPEVLVRRAEIAVSNKRII